MNIVSPRFAAVYKKLNPSLDDASRLFTTLQDKSEVLTVHSHVKEDNTYATLTFLTDDDAKMSNSIADGIERYCEKPFPKHETRTVYYRLIEEATKLTQARTVEALKDWYLNSSAADIIQTHKTLLTFYQTEHQKERDTFAKEAIAMNRAIQAVKHLPGFVSAHLTRH